MYQKKRESSWPGLPEHVMLKACCVKIFIINSPISRENRHKILIKLWIHYIIYVTKS